MLLRAAVSTVLLVSGSLAWAQPELPTVRPMVLSDALDTYRSARQAGGPGKDGIPSIDEPEFWSAQQAGDYLDDGDLVIGLYHKGEARAYPQRILVWHEIVNDRFGDERVAVTYCPLTGTSLGFDRGRTELGVSGKLVNSNLVMYDRATDTEYPQILGTGIAGPLTGEALREIRVVWTEWGKWRQRYPDTRVLSTDTGYFRNYGVDPYGQYNPVAGYYREESRPIFPVLHRDGRYPNKREILGFRGRETAVAVDVSVLADRGVIHHRNPDGHYVIIHDPVLDTGWVYRADAAFDLAPDDIDWGPDGPEFTLREDLEPVNAFEAMWFAWYAFYPDTEVIDA